MQSYGQTESVEERNPSTTDERTNIYRHHSIARCRDDFDATIRQARSSYAKQHNLGQRLLLGEFEDDHEAVDF